MKTVLKIVGILVVVLVVVMGVGILALPQILSTDAAKTRISSFIEQKTGRKLTITGKTSFKLYPDIGVSLDNISLSNPPRMEGAPLVKMAALHASLKLVPLFKGQVEVADITLIKPHFVLLVDKKGNRNWDFNVATMDAKRGRGRNTAKNSITLGSVAIKNGVVHYLNAQNNIDEKFEAINLTLTQKLPSRAIRIKGNLLWHNEKQAITSRITSPDRLLAGQSSRVFFKLASRFTESQYEGLLDLGDKPSIDGILTSRIPSVRKLARFLGHEIAGEGGFGKLKLKTSIKADARKIDYATKQFLFDNMDLVANGSIDFQKARPVIIANIKTDRLDLNPYVEGESNSDTGEESSSDTSIDLSGLKLMDGTISLKTGELLYKKARLGQGDFHITLKNGVADAVINSLSLYRGSATGKVKLDGNRSTAAISGDLSLENVLTGAILRDFAGIDKLSGKGSLSGDFNVNGNNAREFKSSLKGTLKLNLTRGRIDGFNLAKYVEDLTGTPVPGSGTGRDGKPRTSYDRISATLRVNKGIARNEDFLVTGKFFKARASGRINLVNETMNLRVAPHLFTDNWSFAPPLRITGTWAKPKVGFDAVAFLGGRDAVVRSLGGLFRGESLAESTLLKRRGLQTDEEIESYLAGKKIDPNKGQPAPEPAPAPAAPADGEPPAGTQNGVGTLLQNILP